MSNSISADRLRSIVERIEHLDEERRNIAADIKDIMAEAKSAGFDPKAIRVLLAERRKDAAEVEELAMLVSTYRSALGPLDGTPLGEAAIPGETKSIRKFVERLKRGEVTVSAHSP